MKFHMPLTYQLCGHTKFLLNAILHAISIQMDSHLNTNQHKNTFSVWTSTCWSHLNDHLVKAQTSETVAQQIATPSTT